MIKRGLHFSLPFLLVLLIIPLVSSQDYSLDIKISQEANNVVYNVLLLKDSMPINDTVKVSISDINKKNVMNFTVVSGRDNTFSIEKDFLSGYWQIDASYQNKTVRRFFSVAEREQAEFTLEGDTLVISNNGNVPYTGTVDILIGDKQTSQKQYLDVGKYKQIKLVAPDGNYNIIVSVDGVTKVSKQDVHLTGTGQVIGALDQQLVSNQPTLGSARDVQGDSIFSSRNFSVAVIFIGAVFGLFVLVFIEKVMRKKRASQAKDMMGMH